jgi:TRAP-type C4-dicarboxylate transport system permease small subunit
MASIQQQTVIPNTTGKTGLPFWLELVCRFLENVLIFTAGYMTIAAMIITFIDVIMRYAFNSPMSWVFDFITMYLLPGCYFLAFSYALRTGNHLKVDYFKGKFPPQFTKVCVTVSGLLATALFVYITYTYAIRTYSAWEENEIIYGAVNWLVWPSDFIIAVSSFTFSFRLFLKTLDQFFSEGSDI